MAQRPPVAIVGCGRTGGSIGLALARGGRSVVAAWSATPEGRTRARELLCVLVPERIAEVVADAEIVVVAVTDDAIEKVSVELAPVSASKLVVHTSGATSVSALAAVRGSDGRVGSVHPLQTLPDPVAGAANLVGAPVAVTCAPADRDVLDDLVRDWGGVPFPIDDEAKPLYHAAAVFASNYVAACVAAAVELMTKAGVADAAGTLRPLIEASVSGRITGPAVRGDLTTIARHMDLLRDTPYADAYRALAVLAALQGGGDQEAVEEAVR